MNLATTRKSGDKVINIQLEKPLTCSQQIIMSLKDFEWSSNSLKEVYCCSTVAS